MVEGGPVRVRGFRLIPQDRLLGWTPYIWLAYLPTVFIWPTLTHAPLRVFVWTGIATVVFLALYFRGYWARGRRELEVIVAAIALLAYLLLGINVSAGVFMIYAGAFAGILRPRRVAFISIGALAAAIALEPFLLHVSWSDTWWQLFMTGMIGGANTHFASVRETLAALQRAREEVEQLATLAERERIARDLHDVLGHTLSLITLKSALASRLIERDPAKAAIEMRDVERTSREALAEVRAAVAGYRNVGLAREVAQASTMLRTAGIDVIDRIDAVDLAPSEEAALALALREAVTNVVRHSGASKCELTFVRSDEGRVLTIVDDGSGKRAADGNGVRGMRERIGAVSGELSIRTNDGTHVKIVLPVDLRVGTAEHHCETGNDSRDDSAVA